jgi:hypothetical protein
MTPHKFRIGDEVELPLSDGTPYDFVSETDGIPEELIIHGSLLKRANQKQIGRVMAIHNNYYIVRFSGRHSVDGTGFLQLGFRGYQLHLHKRVKNKDENVQEENYLFNMEDL